MPKKHKYRRFYQILIVPDDDSEPKTFSIAVQKIKYLKIIAVVLTIHIILGAISYYKFFRVNKQNRELVVLNTQLEENNRRIDELTTIFQDLEASQTKVRTALGLGELKAGGPASSQNLDLSSGIVEETIPQYEFSKAEYQALEKVDVKEKLGFLQQSKSGLHDFEKSIPTFLPVEGVLTTDYQKVRLDGQIEHHGIDIAAQRGSFVRATAEGIVVFSGWTFDLGYLIVLFHGNGFMTYYGHNQRNLVQRNDFVKKGDQIALLGSSGHSSAPHLHFEIWKDGVALDPKEFILAFSEISL